MALLSKEKIKIQNTGHRRQNSGDLAIDDLRSTNDYFSASIGVSLRLLFVVGRSYLVYQEMVRFIAPYTALSAISAVNLNRVHSRLFVVNSNPV